MNVRKLAWIENTRLEALEALTQEDSQALYVSLQNALSKELDAGGDEELLSKIESAMDDVEQSWLMPAACKKEEDDGIIIAPTKEQNMDNPSTENRTAEESLETLRIGDLTLNELLSTGLLSHEQFRKAIGWAEGEEEEQPSSSLPEATLVGLSKAEQKAKVLEVIQSLNLETFKNGHILKYWFPNGKGQGDYEALRVKNHQFISRALKAMVTDGTLVKVSATNTCHTGYQLAATPQ